MLVQCHVRGAVEHQVLDEVRQAKEARWLVARADVNTHQHRHVGAGGIGANHDPQTVREASLDDRMREIGKRSARSGEQDQGDDERHPTT